MDWLNIHIARDLRSPAAIGSTPAERGTWLYVLAYCAEQENGGRLVGAAAWKDRQWQQACGVTAREVRAAHKLLTVDGEDVVVHGYPHEKQAEVASRRDGGRLGGAARTEAKATTARMNGMLGGRPSKPKESEPEKPKLEPKDNPSSNPTEGKGKGREGEGNLAAAMAEAIIQKIKTPPPPPGRQYEPDQLDLPGIPPKSPDATPDLIDRLALSGVSYARQDIRLWELLLRELPWRDPVLALTTAIKHMTTEHPEGKHNFAELAPKVRHLADEHRQRAASRQSVPA